MTVNREELGLGMLGLAETLGTFGNLCPSVRDLRQQGRAPDVFLRDDLTRSYVQSTLVSGFIAGAAGLLGRSPAPVVGWLAGLTVAVLTYESNIPTQHRLLGPGDQARLT